MKILFLGTPEFAVPSLQRLIDWNDVSVIGLITQPDRPAGRGKQIIASPTKLLAQDYGIPVFQPQKLSKAPDLVQTLSELKPDILVTVAFGQILKKNVLTLAPYGVMNVHGSLLPKYRGAAPINWAIINGEKITGLTTMFSDEGIDTGKMLLKKEIAISDEMDAEILAQAMSQLGADLLVETLKRLRAGTLEAEAQDEAAASYAPRLSKEMGNINWKKTANEIHNLVRGLHPWPGTYSHLNGQACKIMKTNPSRTHGKHEPGSIITTSGKFLVACGENGSECIEILEVKPANKGRMSAVAWANGLHIKPETVLKEQ